MQLSASCQRPGREEVEMSSGLECQFIEIRKHRWYYLLEDSFAPTGAWDWREYAKAYGPFVNYEAADEHLVENHSNPGGHSISALPEGKEELDLARAPTLAKLIAEATSPASMRQQRHRFR